MSRADEMLLGCGFELTNSPFDDWFIYKRADGVEITFQDDFDNLYCNYEMMLDIYTIEAIHAKMKELGWQNDK